MAGKKHIRLSSPRAVQGFLKKLINEHYRDELEPTKVRNLGYLVKILLDSFEIIELEERILKLEEQLNNKGDEDEIRK